MKFALVSSFLVAAATAASPTCINDEGKGVDWWVAMKVPGGGEYYRFSDGSESFVKSAKDISKGNGDCVGETLDQLYSTKNAATNGYAMWNDQVTHDEAPSATYAHSKGVVHFDETQGFYLIHSMPAFPTAKKGGYDMLPDVTYGQSFMCLTMPTSEFEKLGHAFQTMHVYIFDSYLGSTVGSKVPSLKKAIDLEEDVDVVQRVTNVKTVGGTTFKHFAKGRNSKLALYEDFVSPTLKKDLGCETWQNGATVNKVPTYCPPDTNYTVANINDVQFPSSEVAGGDSWSSTKDHSKWVISLKGFDIDDSKDPWACVGGVNRQASQDKRGGGTMCKQDAKLNSALYDAVKDYEDCQK